MKMIILVFFLTCLKSYSFAESKIVEPSNDSRFSDIGVASLFHKLEFLNQIRVEDLSVKYFVTSGHVWSNSLRLSISIGDYLNTEKWTTFDVVDFNELKNINTNKGIINLEIKKLVNQIDGKYIPKSYRLKIDIKNHFKDGKITVSETLKD